MNYNIQKYPKMFMVGAWHLKQSINSLTRNSVSNAIARTRNEIIEIINVGAWHLKQSYFLLTRNSVSNAMPVRKSIFIQY